MTFSEFLQVINATIRSGSLVKWDTFSVASIGTVALVETRDGLHAYVITDVNFPSKASPTHLHLGNSALFTSATNFTTSSTTFVDVVTGSVSFPSGLSSGLTIVQSVILGTVQCSQSVAADTFDLNIGDFTSGNTNSYTGFNNTDVVSHGLFTGANYVNPASGNHTFKIQAEVSAGADVLTIKTANIAAFILVSQKPLSGT